MRLQGIGIDLVDLRKIRRFLKTHSRKKISRLFTQKELKVLKRASFSVPAVARFICAKEAYFKSLNQSWLGIEGFALMETEILSPSRFLIQKINTKANQPAEGCFFKEGHLMGAQVMRWEN